MKIVIRQRVFSARLRLLREGEEEARESGRQRSACSFAVKLSSKHKRLSAAAGADKLRSAHSNAGHYFLCGAHCAEAAELLSPLLLCSVVAAPNSSDTRRQPC